MSSRSSNCSTEIHIWTHIFNIRHTRLFIWVIRNISVSSSGTWNAFYSSETRERNITLDFTTSCWSLLRFDRRTSVQHFCGCSELQCLLLISLSIIYKFTFTTWLDQTLCIKPPSPSGGFRFPFWFRTNEEAQRWIQHTEFILHTETFEVFNYCTILCLRQEKFSSHQVGLCPGCQANVSSSVLWSSFQIWCFCELNMRTLSVKQY